MFCKVQYFMRRIVKIRQNHPFELFLLFIHLFSSDKLIVDYDSFKHDTRR